MALTLQHRVGNGGANIFDFNTRTYVCGITLVDMVRTEIGDGELTIEVERVKERNGEPYIVKKDIKFYEKDRDAKAINILNGLVLTIKEWGSMTARITYHDPYKTYKILRKEIQGSEEARERRYL
ncbi:MAG: hypothetical protein ABIH25_05410 [Candidatus Woesearchaeota archaeon]